MVKYNKLVRDKIPEYICTKGGSPITRFAGDAEYWQKLKEKLLEEVGEFREDESVEEFADILEVLDAIAVYKGFEREEVEKIKLEKRKERGGFQKRIILDES